MKKILAVSGGVDSMVLFDMFYQEALKTNSVSDIVVAHFNHGTRPSANDDEKFVEKVAKERGVKFERQKINLGEKVSEDEARKARYKFLFELAQKYSEDGVPAKIVTAHHLDDLVESVSINLIRGTGWRGLAPMGNTLLERPFLEKGWGRADILKYASKNDIIFRFDPTNASDHYLRNCVREKLALIEAKQREEILETTLVLYKQQVNLRQEISDITRPLVRSATQYPRDWFKKDDESDEIWQLELLREILNQAGISATRPQMLNFLKALQTFQPGKSFNLPGDRLVKIHKTYFAL